MVDHQTRLARAWASLEGLSTGDGFGDGFFGVHTPASIRIQERMLLNPPWHFSDDSMMALSIFSILRQYGEINQDQLAQSFAERYEQSRGYGPSARRLLGKIREGGDWREATYSVFKGQGSYGNGGAMRVAPLGAYFADDLPKCIEQARLSAEITHAHPEGIAGTIAIAVAAAIAWQTKAAIPSRQEFIEKVWQHTPDSLVREKLGQAYHLAPSASVELAIAALGNGTGLSAQDTVPFTVWCAGGYLNQYEEAMWLTVSAIGDADTNCAIVGGIVAAHVGYEGIPAEWVKRREPLPAWAFEENGAPFQFS